MKQNFSFAVRSRYNKTESDIPAQSNNSYSGNSSVENTKTARTSSKNALLAAGLAIGLTGTVTAQADVMLGASLPNDGFSRPVIAEFNQKIQKELAYVNVFSAFSHDWDNLYWQSSNVVAEGAMPMISWMPIDLSRRDDNLLPEIAIGMWDDYLTLWGTKLLAWVNSYPEAERPRLSIRFAHEFNGNWYPYSNTPVAYTAAWQHIHDMFTEMGVNEHVDWVWSASKTNVDDYSDFTVYYPGDDYVDWTSLDGYNWGSNYVSGGWSSFSTIFDEAYQILVANYPAKPIMIAETGSAEPYDLPNTQYGMYGDDSDAFESKTLWISDMLRDLETTYPAVRALSLFNINKELGWSISTEINSGLDGWIQGTESAHFTSEYLIVSNESANNSDAVFDTAPVLTTGTNDVVAADSNYDANFGSEELESPIVVDESNSTEDSGQVLLALNADEQITELDAVPAETKNGKNSGGKGKSNTKRVDKEAHTALIAEKNDARKELVKARKIDMNEQRRIANESRAAIVKTRANIELENAFRNMSKRDKDKMKNFKHSVIEY